jgi:hypothetical protein
MSSQTRIVALLMFSGLILGILLWDQSGEMDLVKNKVSAREGRLEESREILSRNPQLLKGSKKIQSKEKDERSLMTIFSQMLANKKLDQQIISLTPSTDKKKKWDKVRLQLKNLPLKNALSFVTDLKVSHPEIVELEIDLQAMGRFGWKLTGTWAMDPKGL